MQPTFGRQFIKQFVNFPQSWTLCTDMSTEYRYTSIIYVDMFINMTHKITERDPLVH